MALAPTPNLLFLIGVAPVVEFFFYNEAPVPFPASVRFYTLIFSIVFVCLKLNRKCKTNNHRFRRFREHVLTETQHKVTVI